MIAMMRAGSTISPGKGPVADSVRQIKRFFLPGGALAAAHPSFESRPGQVEMALAVENALAEGRKLIVEAGTGTGKTLAYLVPALLSERRVVVSTGTKALQEQLFFRDIPFLEKVLAVKLIIPNPVSGSSNLKSPNVNKLFELVAGLCLSCPGEKFKEMVFAVLYGFSATFSI